jgi:hypothetical protein
MTFTIFASNSNVMNVPGLKKDDNSADTGDAMAVWTIHSIYVSTPPRMIIPTPRRRKEKYWGRQKDGNKSAIIRVPGPNQKKDEEGDELIEEADLKSLFSQGHMVTGFVTNGYLNLLSRRFHKECYKRVPSFVLKSLQLKKSALEEACLRNGDFGTVYPNDACANKDVRTAPLVFVPVFYASDEGGHWALLVIDRTEYEPGIAIFFDSSRDCNFVLYNHAKSTFELCGLTGHTWIKADMPTQGINSNDCGVWMCCIAGIYARSVSSRIHTLSRSETVPFRNVTLLFGNGVSDEVHFGHAGREHIASSLSELSIDINSAFFDSAYLSFTT